MGILTVRDWIAISFFAGIALAPLVLMVIKTVREQGWKFAILMIVIFLGGVALFILMWSWLGDAIYKLVEAGIL